MYTYECDQPKLKPQKSTADYTKDAVRSVVNVSKEFCMETGIHGFRHLAEPDRHWLERILWAAVICFAFYGALDVSRGQLQRYNESPTVVTYQKDFRFWKPSLPAITICTKNRVDPEKLPDVIKSFWDVDQSDDNYDYYVKFVNMVANSNILNLTGYKDIHDEELDVNLLELVVEVAPKLGESLNIKTDSSENAMFKWTPIMTESGICFSTNSLAIEDVAIVKTDLNHTKDYPITCRFAAHSCLMKVEVFSESYYTMHSPYDIMDITSQSTHVHSGLNRALEIAVVEMGCGKGVKDLAPKRRGCLYTDEPTGAGRHVYSTNTCRLGCRNQIAMKECNCKPFYYFYERGPLCTLEGMACLADLAKYLSKVNCSCSSQCVDSFFQETATSELLWQSGPFSASGWVKYTVQVPKTRYTREIVFYIQDLVVSFGGAAGLFLGASFISFVEILYFVMMKCFGAMSDTRKRQQMPKNQSLSFEQKQIKDLDAILEKNGYDQNTNRLGVVTQTDLRN